MLQRSSLFASNMCMYTGADMLWAGHASEDLIRAACAHAGLVWWCCRRRRRQAKPIFKPAGRNRSWFSWLCCGLGSGGAGRGLFGKGGNQQQPQPIPAAG